MISRQYKTIFIHIEKTAGTSIEKKLGLFETLERGVQDHRNLKYFEHMSQHAYKLSNLNFVIKNFKRKKYNRSFRYIKNMWKPELSLNEYHTFYKFTFVRNSWSRIHSFYYNIMRDDYLKTNYMGIKGECSLHDFIKYYLDYDKFSQLNYITDSRGDIPLDFIGRFENLNSDFKKVCLELQIEDDSLPNLLIIKNKDYYKDNYDDKTKDLVYNIFKKEIDYFDFEF